MNEIGLNSNLNSAENDFFPMFSDNEMARRHANVRKQIFLILFINFESYF